MYRSARSPGERRCRMRAIYSPVSSVRAQDMRWTMVQHASLRIAVSCLLMMVLPGIAWPQQSMSSLERGRALDMVQVVSSDVKKHYYDTKFHGVDFDAKVAEAKQQ